jgi:hypothetical protein
VGEVPIVDDHPTTAPLALEVKTLELLLASLERALGWYVELFGPKVTEDLLARAVNWRRDAEHGELSPALQMLAREASK